MKQDDFERDLNDLIRESSSLFGDVEGMDRDELVGTLDGSGSASRTIRESMYVRIEGIVKAIRLKGESPPQRYLDALNQLRPPTAVPHGAKALVEHARKCVSDLLRGPQIGTELRLQCSFHNRSELTSEDEQLLRRAEDDVRKRAEPSK